MRSAAEERSEDRRIRGRHFMEGIWADDASRTVFVTGLFEGRGGDAIAAVRFAVVGRFGGAGLVTRRQTFLALGHAYAER